MPVLSLASGRYQSLETADVQRCRYFPYDIGYLSTVAAVAVWADAAAALRVADGYFGGYVVVYDPLTYFISDVVGLLQ